MDKTREARNPAIGASNGLSRRRSRSSVVRENLDDGHAVIQYGSCLRDRMEKRDRDRDSLNRNKRRRSDRILQRNEREEEGEESSDDSLLADNEIPHFTASFQGIHRKSLPLPCRARLLKVADEMIGVPVPRKARSACVKRSHECRTSSASASPASQSFEAGSPSSSNVSVKQRMKSNESNNRQPKQPPKSSGSAQNDLEFEIAEVLSGLKQSQSLKKEDETENSVKSSELKDVNIISHDTNPSHVDSRKMEGKAEDSSVPVVNSSVVSTVKAETQSHVKVEMSASKSDRTAKSNVEINEENPKRSLEEESCCRDGLENKEKFDPKDSTATKGKSEVAEGKRQREDSNNNNNNKLKIDLMAPPSLPSSPERGAFVPLASDFKPMAQNSDEKEILFKDEKVATEESGEKKENGEWLKLDLEMASQNNGRDCSRKLQNQGQTQQKDQQPATAILPKTENIGAQPNSTSSSSAAGSWANGHSPFGYMPPFQTIKPKAGTTESSPAIQSTRFISSQPWPKRCATHCFIACNIQLHQQFMKTNAGSASSLAGCPRNNNLYVVPPPAEKLLHGNPSLQGSFPGLSLNSTQAKGQITANMTTLKDKASDSSADFTEATQKKLVVNHQAPLQSPVLQLPGPAFIFPMTHHHQPVAATTNQPTPSKSVTSTQISSLSGSSASLNFNFQSSAASEAPPYLTILPNTGYPFPVPTQSAVKGGNPAQAMPFFSGSFYSSHMSVPSQYQQQQQVQRDTSTSIGPSSSHKQPHSQATTVQKQHLSSTHQSHKLETKVGGEKSSVVSDSWVPHSQRGTYGQTSTVPLQPLNFSMSFASLNGGGTSSTFNFSSVGQTPAVAQANGYHVVAAPPRSVQQKNHEITESKIDDGKKISMGKTPTIPNGQTLVFDNSARTLNFVSSPATSNWPHCAITTTAMTSNSPVYSSLPNSQQLQVQKHHLRQQQTQQSGRSKSTATNTLPASSIAAKFPSSISVFPQTTVHVNSFASQSAQWKNSVASSSFAAGSPLNLKQFQQQQQNRTQQGQTQISFLGNSKTVLLQSQGQQQILPSSQSQSSMIVGSPPHSKANSTGNNKTGSSAPTSQLQQTESSSSGQKSSPVCGRNVPSIISSCPSQLSELR